MFFCLFLQLPVQRNILILVPSACITSVRLRRAAKQHSSVGLEIRKMKMKKSIITRTKPLQHQTIHLHHHLNPMLMTMLLSLQQILFGRHNCRRCIVVVVSTLVAIANGKWRMCRRASRLTNLLLKMVASIRYGSRNNKLDRRRCNVALLFWRRSNVRKTSF